MSRRRERFLSTALSEPGRLSPPIWSCTARGLPCHCHYWQRGGLLPHLFTLTCVRTIRRHPGGFPPGYHRVPLRRRSILCGTFRDATLSNRIPWRYQARRPCPQASQPKGILRSSRSGVRTFLPLHVALGFRPASSVQPAIIQPTRQLYYTAQSRSPVGARYRVPLTHLRLAAVDFRAISNECREAKDFVVQQTVEQARLL
jgi:hypothetical protein